MSAAIRPWSNFIYRGELYMNGFHVEAYQRISISGQPSEASKFHTRAFATCLVATSSAVAAGARIVYITGLVNDTRQPRTGQSLVLYLTPVIVWRSGDDAVLGVSYPGLC